MTRMGRGWKVWVGLLLMVLLVRLTWGGYASYLRERELDLVRTRGEPVTIDDLAATRVPLPDDQNAAVVFQNAMNAVSRMVESPSDSNFEFPWYPPYNAQWLEIAGASEESNAQAFTMARAARALRRSQMSLPTGSPLVNQVYIPYMSDSRRLANTLVDGAVYVQQIKNHAEAVDRLIDALGIGESLQHQDTLLAQLLGAGIYALVCDRAMIIAPHLRFSPGGITRPASREAVQLLIDRLLDDQLALTGFRRGILMDRVLMIDWLDTSAENTWFLRPLADMDVARKSREHDAYVNAIQGGDYPASDKILRRAKKYGGQMQTTMYGPVFDRVPRYSRWFDSFGTDNTHLHFPRIFQSIAERRMTAISLAAQLYRADHGNWPRRLNDLVPAYLAALPTDPFRADGGTFGYEILLGVLPDGSDRPLLSCEMFPAGRNWVDPEPMYGYQSAPSSQTAYQRRDLAWWKPLSRRFDEEEAARLEAEKSPKQDVN